MQRKDRKILYKLNDCRPGISAELEQVLVARNQVIGLGSLVALENAVVGGMAGDNIKLEVRHNEAAES